MPLVTKNNDKRISLFFMYYRKLLAID